MVLQAVTPEHMGGFVDDTQTTPDGVCPGGVCSSGETITWNLGSIGAGETRLVTVIPSLISSTTTGARDGTCRNSTRS